MEMYLRCAECEPDEGFKANHLRDAAIVIKNQDTDQYIKLITQAIELFSITGRTTQASSLAKDCAEKLEEDYNYEDALKFYEKAADFFLYPTVDDRFMTLTELKEKISENQTDKDGKLIAR